MDDSLDSHFVVEITNAQPKLRAYLAKMLANSSSTDDVLQEANKVLWLKREQWDPTTPFLKWAYRVAYFQAKAFLRDHSRDKLVFREELLELFASETPQETRPTLLEEALNGCLKKLEESRRQLVLRHYDPEIPLETLAQEQGISHNALSQKLRRIRHSLHRCVQNTLSSNPASS